MEQKIVFDKSGCKVTWSHTLALWLWIGWITVYLVLLMVLPPLLYFGLYLQNAACKSILFYLTTTLFVFAVLPCERKVQPQWAKDIGDWIAHRACEYFSIKVVLEDEEALSKASPAFFVLEPHDVLPLSIISFSDAVSSIKSHKFAGCITSFCFLIPFMRHFYSWARAVPATKEVINDLLFSGVSPCICPGGVQEAALIAPQAAKEINVYLLKRKGFVKIAISHGVPIVPVFCFGLQSSFDFYVIKNSLLKWIGRKIGFMPMIFFGAHGIPYGPAKSCPYVNVVGAPIPTGAKKPYKEVTDTEVDVIHAAYIEALKALYERNKAKYGYGDIKLNIH